MWISLNTLKQVAALGVKNCQLRGPPVFLPICCHVSAQRESSMHVQDRKHTGREEIKTARQHAVRSRTWYAEVEVPNRKSSGNWPQPTAAAAPGHGRSSWASRSATQTTSSPAMPSLERASPSPALSQLPFSHTSNWPTRGSDGSSCGCGGAT